MGKTEDFVFYEWIDMIYLGFGLCLYARSLGPVFIPIYQNLELPPDLHASFCIN